MKKPARHTLKDPDEKIFIDADFTSYLATSETISSQVWECVVKVGTDSNATAMLSGTPTKTGAVCSQLLIDGVHGNEYVVSCLATTSTGQILKLSYQVPVRTQELL